MATLVIKEAGTVRSVPLAEKITTIGRTPANTIRIEDGAASRNHCMIKAEADCHVLVDLRSANGTSVNGERVKEHPLSEGDRIQIGKAVLIFRQA